MTEPAARARGRRLPPGAPAVSRGGSVAALAAAACLAVAWAGCGGAEAGDGPREGAGAPEAVASTPAAAAPLPPLPELPPDAPPGVTPERLARGRDLFLGPAMCAVCHGPDGRGARGVGADLTDDQWWHSDGTYPAIVDQVKRGVAADRVRNTLGAAMPPRGGTDLTDEQVLDVAAWVWSLRLGAPRPP